ncbi:MAG TPA: hypothetical protein VGP24_08670 [Glaciihabitans sp.]|jgi:hypothetical protein|nr:hypothetical protein [Glaciihabitans sp.]
MNSTNRPLNRLFIAVVGIIVLTVGLTAIALVTLEPVATLWSDAAPGVVDAVNASVIDTRIPNTVVSWVAVATLAGLLLLLVLLAVFIFRQGRGHTSRLITAPATGHGQVRIDSAVAEQSLSDVLSRKAELMSSHVTTYTVRGTSVLKISVTCRRGVAPPEVVGVVEESLSALEDLLGSPVPALLEINSGFRSRLSSATRLA